MHRGKLLSAIENASTGSGYKPYTGFLYSMNGNAVKFPAAWLIPPAVVKWEGRKEGYITYSATLYLMKIETKISPDIREDVWSEMEKEAYDIITAIGECRDIFNIQNVKITPSEYSLSKHGELSVKLEFEARMQFYK